MRWLPGQVLKSNAPPDPTGGAQELPALELLGSVVERSLDSQERRIAGLDQRGGVLLGFSGLLLGLLARTPQDASWWQVVSGCLALAAAVFSALEIRPIRSDRIRPRRLLEEYAGREPEAARLAVLSSLAFIFDAEEDVASRKGDHLRRAIILLVASGTILLLGVTVDSGAVVRLADDLRRLR